MKKDIDTGNSKPGNPAVLRIPLHYWFAEKLIINEITGEMPEIHMPAVFWSIKRRLLRKFIWEYFEKHEEIPGGCLGVWKIENCHLFKGVIDFDAVKQKIYEDMKHKYDRNRQAWNAGSVRSDFKFTSKFRI